MKIVRPLLLAALFAAGCATPGGETAGPEGRPGLLPADGLSGALDQATKAAKEPKRGDTPSYAIEVEEASSGTPEPAPAPADVSAAPDSGGGVGAARSKPGMPGRTGGRAASAGVKAGFHDDNLQFGAYLDFLGKFRHAVPIFVDVSNRIVVRAMQGQGGPASFATIVFRDASGKYLAERTAYADGRAVFSPSEFPSAAQEVKLEAKWKGETVRLSVDPAGKKTVEIAFGASAKLPARVPVDIAFVLDTTGSMADEISRLKATLHAVHAAILESPEKPNVRFGMVLYRDRGDAYVTQKVPFTDDIEKFAGALNMVAAGGGGDTPEDLQAALSAALKDLSWRESAVRVAFVITDAAPHVYEDQVFNYAEAGRNAAARGIKIVGIGASGLSTQGEIVLRHLAQFTMAQFVFLTYGESGDSSEAGSPARVSHHTGGNFQVRNLDAIIVRFVRSELMALKGESIPDDDWMEAAAPGGGEDRDAIFTKLFDGGVQRLLEYTLVPVEAKTAVAVLPMTVSDPALKSAAETCESHLILAVSRSPSFRIVEHGKDLRQILEEQALGLTGAVAEADAPKVGKLVGAKLLVFSKMTAGTDRPEILLKLVRTETAEVLAVSLLKLAPELVR